MNMQDDMNLDYWFEELDEALLQAQFNEWVNSDITPDVREEFEHAHSC